MWVSLPGSSCYSSSHLCTTSLVVVYLSVRLCAWGLIWLKNIPFFELLVILNWDQLHDPVHQVVSWRAALALLGSAVWAAVSFCQNWQLKEMLMTLVLVAFHVGAKSQMWFFQKEKSMDAPFLLSVVPACFVFLIFSNVFSITAWFSAGCCPWPTIPNF